jgi:hypothetical protein
MFRRGRPRGRPRFAYSRWDGTQTGFDFGADDLMGQLTDDLLYHGDVNAALRRLMQQGFDGPDGERLQGMRELMEKLREQRQERLENHDLGGVYDDIANELRDVVDLDRTGLEDLAREAAESGDARRPGPPRTRHSSSMTSRPTKPGTSSTS